MAMLKTTVIFLWLVRLLLDKSGSKVQMLFLTEVSILTVVPLGLIIPLISIFLMVMRQLHLKVENRP
ncbi:hypothetical protein WMF06_004306 [Salmonella enterica]